MTCGGCLTPRGDSCPGSEEHEAWGQDWGQQCPSAGTALTQDAWNQQGGQGGCQPGVQCQPGWVTIRLSPRWACSFPSMAWLELMLRDQFLVNRGKRSL